MGKGLSMPELEIIIVNYQTPDLTLNCLKSIFSKNWTNEIDVIVVDNNSKDNSLQIIKNSYSQIKIIESSKNLGFTGGNNLGLNETTANLVLLLNSDTLVKTGALDNLINFANSTDYGIISCQLLNPDGSFQPNGGKLPNLANLLLWLSNLDDLLNIPSYQMKNRSDFKTVELGWISGAVMLIKKDVIEKIGLLDENIFMYGEDVEYCLRAKRAGIKVGWTNQAQITHLGGGSLRAPKFKQWLGEFKGLIYIYQKYYGNFLSVILKFLLYFFVLLRGLAFLLIGRYKTTLIYAKIFTEL